MDSNNSSSNNNSNRFLRILREFHIRHENLKRYVHEGFRYPLPPMGVKMMAFVYFSIPIAGGLYLMGWVDKKNKESILENGEKLLKRKEISDGSSGQLTGDRRADGLKIGGDGWGGGTRLVVSDDETRIRNQRKLEQFLKHLDQGK